jgi:PhnB protein
MEGRGAARPHFDWRHGADGGRHPKRRTNAPAYLTLGMDGNTEAERVFAALSDGGRALMPIEETFFAFRFGQDRFGIIWMILHERPSPPRR